MSNGYQGYSSMGGGGGNNNYNSNYGNSNQNDGYGGNSNQGGGNSGGFMPSGSQSNQTEERAGSRDTIHPINIMQITEVQSGGQDEIYVIGNVEVRNITLVARINNISVQTTKVIYRLDDGTGNIEAHLWLDKDKQEVESSEKEAEGIAVESYVRVFGKIKEQPNRRYISAVAIKPITDMNEVFCHVQDIIQHHLFATRGPLNTLTEGGQGSGQQQNTAFGAGAGAGQSAASFPVTNKNLQNASMAARRVFGVIQKANNHEGIHFHLIAQQLGLSHPDTQRAGDELISLGLVYTPSDDDTWAELAM